MSAAALNPLAFPLRNSHLIEASAGTGKTYTIAALYLRLVLGHDPEDQGQLQAGQRMKTPPEILVVTFTEAATQELRDRIRARLTEAASFFREELRTNDTFLIGLRAAYAEQSWPTQARILDLAAQQMDEAAVSTIHGWCNRMLSEHAFASGSLFSQTLNTDNSELWQQAAQDYWRHFVASLKDHEVEKYEFLVDALYSPDKLLERTRELQQSEETMNDDDLSAVDSFLAAQQELRDQWHDVAAWQTALADFEEHFVAQIGAQVKVDGRKLKVPNLQAWLAQVQEWLAEISATGERAPLQPSLTEAGTKRLTPEGLAEACKTELNAQQLALPQRLVEFTAAVAALPNPHNSILRHAGRWLQQRFRQLQQQRAEIGFNDMLTRLRDALRAENGELLAAQLRKQFPIAMIDEFQDTDPVQYEIFDRVYRIAETPESNGLFLIGDPKQAIYSFRNADIFTYLKARRATAGRHHTLGTNFRSTQAMVDSVNALFEQAEASRQGAFRFKTEDGANEMPFQPVKANDLDRELVVGGAVQQALAVMDYSDQKGNNGELDLLLAEAFAETITQLLNDPDTGFRHRNTGELTRIAPRDMAVLVASGSQAQLIRAALRRRRLRSVYLSERDSVFAGRVAQELYTLLHACAYPRDPRRLRSVLGCELLGMQLDEIDAINTNELQWDSFAVQFVEFNEIWLKQGILPMVQHVLHEFAIPQRLLALPNGERELTDILHLAELLQQHAQQVEGTHGLLRFLAEHIAKAQDNGSSVDAAEQQVRLESDAELIQVVTIHKSKGLQYPLVFLPFVSRTRDQSRMRFPQRYHNEHGELAICFDKEDESAKARVVEEAFAEEIRKLYVAVTRAQYATYVGVAGYKTLPQTAWHYLFAANASEQDAVSYKVDGYSTSLAPNVAGEPTRYQAPQVDDQDFSVRRLPEGFGFESWWMASYSALRYGEWITADDADAENLQEGLHDVAPDVPAQPQLGTIHSFTRGAEAGTFLHNLLEAAADEGFQHLATQPEQCQRWLSDQLRHITDDSEQQSLQQWLPAYLTTRFPLGDEAAPVQLADLQQYQAEPEFWFPTHRVQATDIDRLVGNYVLPNRSRPKLLERILNGMLKGFIDLVFEWQGKYYVADYKSNYLGADATAYSEEAMEHKILESRYDLQFVIYTLALHKLLKARLGDAYDYDKHVGGSVYLFLRGYEAETAGAYFHRPARALIEQLEQCFAGKEAI
ncbi:exodeoxyribonuclease V subunit beta [Pseudidiomarina homiensis]|uniref:exodeoxyribonuclease V subunit beta n=1 Tax=Pseudidiomarina homiensis TaxID=364198 RepID=UPI00215A96FF|nr:exodeoxyribonuclease V subunit beta [Pseudidiomarina homiensis]